MAIDFKTINGKRYYRYATYTNRFGAYDRKHRLTKLGKKSKIIYEKNKYIIYLEYKK